MTGIDYNTVAGIVTAFVIPALAGVRWYLVLRSKKGAIQADVHAIRIAVDDIDDAVQAGQIPPEDAALKIWEDVLNVKKAVKATAAPAPAPVSPAPSA